MKTLNIAAFLTFAVMTASPSQASDVQTGDLYNKTIQVSNDGCDGFFYISAAGKVFGSTNCTNWEPATAEHGWSFPSLNSKGLWMNNPESVGHLSFRDGVFRIDWVDYGRRREATVIRFGKSGGKLTCTYVNSGKTSCRVAKGNRINTIQEQTKQGYEHPEMP